MTALVMSLCLTSCGSKEEAPAEEPAQEEEQEQEEEQPEEPVVDATKYGYGGEDPVEAAIYKYLVEEARKITVSDYVNLNGLDDVKYYQDEGWDPVELYKQ